MTPHCVLAKFITQEQLAIHKQVVEFVNGLQDQLSSLQVVALVNYQFPGVFRSVTGRFNTYKHSWLQFVNADVIIDPYPWAVGSGPIILDIRFGSPWLSLYTESTLANDCANFD